MIGDANKIQEPVSSTAKCYAKRLTSPFSGVIQIVETDKTRALSLNGKTWEIQYLHEAPASFWGRKGDTSITRHYARVARLSDIPDSSNGNNNGKEPHLYLYPHDPRINRQNIKQGCENLLNIILYLKVPLTIQDNYEYWLMDEDEKKPLALLSSCCSQDECTRLAHSPFWGAIPASQLELANNDSETELGLPPLTYRLEQLVRKRSGQNPRACWFHRQPNGDGVILERSDQAFEKQDFPPFLLREDWTDPLSQDLCHRYLQHLSPRLLMLQNLDFSQRDKAERLAHGFAMEVEHYFNLYPDIANKQRMTATRVEARMRRSIGD